MIIDSYLFSYEKDHCRSWSSNTLILVQMEFARYEHETDSLRNQLRMREANRDQAKSNWEMKEKQMQAMMQQVQLNAVSWHTYGQEYTLMPTFRT